MGFLGSLFGTNSSYKTPDDVGGNLAGGNAGFANTQQQQQALIQALQAQGGLQNQSNVFNQQQNTANQLQNIANGQGPNPAQAMLANATGANNAAQAALMAGQRGAGANSGLMARQIGQQGAATQQQAVGQGAVMQANQSLGALGQLQGQQQAMGSLASQQAGQQIGAQQQANQLAGQNLQTQAGLASNANQIAGQQAMANAKNNQGMVGGVLGGIGAALGLAKGGQVPQYADGGMPGGPSDTGFNATSVPGGPADTGLFAVQTPTANTSGPRSSFGQSLGKGIQSFGKSVADSSAMPELKIQPLQQFFSHGGKVPAMVSPGEKIIPKSEVAKVAAGHKDPMEAGKTVPGPNGKGKKDSLKNDTVPKTLTAGDIVLPKSVVNAKNPHWAAHKFVASIMKEKGLSTRKPKV